MSVSSRYWKYSAMIPMFVDCVGFSTYIDMPSIVFADLPLILPILFTYKDEDSPPMNPCKMQLSSYFDSAVCHA